MNKKLWKNINWYIPLLIIMLITFGLIAISSAVEINHNVEGAMYFLQKQIAAVVLGILLIVIMQFFDYRIFQYYNSVYYLAAIAVLAVLLVVGRTVAGGTRWLALGPVNFQVSELTKIIMILVLAGVIDNNKKEIEYLIGFVKPILYVIPPFVLIILQNDLGTALVLIAILIGLMYVGGANKWYMLGLFGGGFLSIVTLIASHLLLGTPLPFLKEYQLNRIIAFLDPSIAPYTIGYQINQSKIAIGSGRLLGKGLFEGTQNQLEFLPEKHTDFIFSVIGEEFGFIGVIIIISLYALLIWQIFKIALEARDDFGRLIAVGVGVMFAFHVIENIGMTMGLMPITGLPLPFISYGGSSMASSLVAIGLVINVNIRRKKITF